MPLSRAIPAAKDDPSPRKPKSCANRECGAEFTPTLWRAKVCSPRCAIAWAHQQAEAKAGKAARRQKAEGRARLMTRADWIKKAQAAFNAYIRARDWNQPCISCGRWHEGQWQAGHYLGTKAFPELRFNEDNVNRQCSPCNGPLAGNVAKYRIGLIARIGLERVEWLEGPHPPAKYSIAELQGLEAHYKASLRALNRRSA